jgi:hypothetical protein
MGAKPSISAIASKSSASILIPRPASSARDKRRERSLSRVGIAAALIVSARRFRIGADTELIHRFGDRVHVLNTIDVVAGAKSKTGFDETIFKASSPLRTVSVIRFEWQATIPALPGQAVVVRKNHGPFQRWATVMTVGFEHLPRSTSNFARRAQGKSIPEKVSINAKRHQVEE